MKISLMFLTALSLAVAGCKEKQKAADPNNACSNAINNSMALSKAEMAKMPDMDAKMVQKMADLGIQHCKEDKWSADAIKCMTGAKTMTDAQGCYGKLTPAQQEGMNTAAMELAMGDGRVDRVGAPGEGSAGTAGSAGSGSDGAPGAGSAAGSAAAAATGDGSSGSAAAPK